MLRHLMENSLEICNISKSKNKNTDTINNNSLLKKSNNIPKLYQKKKVAFLSKPMKVENISNIKEYENYLKLFETKHKKQTNYANIYNKNNSINFRYYKNCAINKSNINTINSTTNNTNNNTILNNTNNININNISNIMSNNLYSINTIKNKNRHNKKKSQIIIKENKINNINDNDSDINDISNDETEEEKIPVHISNYKGGLKGNRDWGLSKTDIKKDKFVNNETNNNCNNNNTFFHRNNDNKYKFNTYYDCIKKQLLYGGKNKVNFDGSVNKINDNNSNQKKNYNRMLTSPGNNLNKIKKLNFDQPFKCLKIGNLKKNIEKINKIPKLVIDLSHLKFKKDNSIKCTTSASRDQSERNTKQLGNNLILVKSSENIKKNKFNQIDENNISEKIKKKDLLSVDRNKYDNDLGHKNVHNNNSCSKSIKTSNQSDRIIKPTKLIYSYSIKRFNKLNISNCRKIIRHMRINENNKNKKTNFHNFIFDTGNIKFKNYIQEYLDVKSIIILSSTNKDFYKNFRYLIYDKYYIELLLENNSKENINKIIKSLLNYSSSKLRNKKKEEIEQIYNSFNFKSIYNEDIIKDLTRTFPNDNTFNKNSLGYYKLCNILTAYSNFNKQIGYTQGLNFMSAIGLSLFDKEEEVFVFLDGLINRFELDKYMGINNKNLVNNLKYFSNILNKYVPDIISFFDSKMVNHEFFSNNWILTLFSNCMNKNCLIIIWSFMIIFGWKFFYCFAIELLNFYKEDILKMKENELNYKMKYLLNNDKYEKNVNLIIKNTLQLMKNCISF